jgi:STE24 endopeptidase
MILLLRDLASAALWWGFNVNLQAAKFDDPSATDAAKIIEWCLIPLSAAAVFILAPEILRRVLKTEPLEDSALRRRLEEMCQRSGLRYRDILLWKTGNNMGNAAVMGVLPQVRYILLSDLLLETMTNQQIEAVFAHEAGHVVHRHIAWYGVFVVIVIAVQVVLAELARMFDVQFMFVPPWLRDPLILGIAVACLFLLFGMLSRWFERQADVYAARIMERELATGPDVRASDFPTRPIATAILARQRRDIPGTVVGQQGADVFASALHRVAVVNNIPIEARNFTHGSISDRVQYLRQLSADPARTKRFDRFMTVLYTTLLSALVTSIAWVTLIVWKG